MKVMKSNGCMVLLALVFTIGAFSLSYAKSSYMTTFDSTYPGSPLKGNCAVCHPGGVGSKSNLDSYANAWVSSGKNFKNIELQDSDGDAHNNITEINAGTYPGDSSSVPITVPVISSFTATPGSITSGGSSTLAWSLSGGTPTTLTINGVSALGLTSKAVSPGATTTYTLTASNSGGTVTALATVTVTAAPPVVTAPVISSFTATPGSITSGGSSTLSWTLSGGTPTTLTINGVSALGSTSKAVSPGATTTYTLTASNSGGTVTALATLTVTAAPPGVTAPVISSFTANPNSITSGESSTLSWTLSGGTPTTLSIDNGVESVLGSISKTVTPGTTTTYTLTASNSGGTVTALATLTVTAAPPGVTAPVISSFTANPGSITSGGSSTLSWSLSGGTPTTLTINGVSVLGLASKDFTPGATTTYTLTASNSGGTKTQSVTVTVTASPPPPVSSQDLAIWVGQWFKITSRYNGYLAQSSKVNTKRASIAGYVKIRSWNPDKNVLQADLYEYDSNEGKWVSEALPLQYLAGGKHDFLVWSQVTGDFTSGFTARIQGKDKGGVLESASFKTMGGFYIELISRYGSGTGAEAGTEASEHYAGGLSITGNLIPEAKVPVTKETILQ